VVTHVSKFSQAMNVLEPTTSDSGALPCPDLAGSRRVQTNLVGSIPGSKTYLAPLFPGSSKHYGARVQKLHERLHTDKLQKFFHPVTLAQVETAIEFLDARYGRWDDDEELGVWEYLLPAIHKLFPEHRLHGFAASFGPPRLATSNWNLPLWLMVFTGAIIFAMSVLWWVLNK
jgi:hypothetical protein